MQGIGRRTIGLGLALAALLAGTPASAHVGRGSDSWAEADPGPDTAAGEDTIVLSYAALDRLIDRTLAGQAVPAAFEGYGPFIVINAETAAMVGTVDSDTPAAFAAMRAAYPHLMRIEMIDCPGSDDDDANLALGRMVHAAGIAMHVPDGGSVRSGAVELFLAGRVHSADPGAAFAVHSWRDSDGHDARDVAESDPVHQDYYDYYADIGLDPDIARRFYAFSNATAFDAPRFLVTADLVALGVLAADPG